MLKLVLSDGSIKLGVSVVRPLLIALLAAGLTSCGGSSTGDARFPLVDTGQTKCFNASVEIASPASGQPFYGQDAQFSGSQPSYTRSSDGLTVYDNVTELTWQQGYEIIPKSWTDARAVPAALNEARYGGYSDWRLPTIKELYSLWDGSTGWPHIDTDYFAHDPQLSPHGIFWSSVKYSGRLESTIDPAIGAEMAFGVNFDTGHIKAYSVDVGPRHGVRCVRGADYGGNDFLNNGDGTITDQATGLMWAQADSGSGMDWEHALAFAVIQNAANYLGHNDWRLPNTRELQSLVDYARSPGATDEAQVGPAIDPLFSCTGITNEAGAADYPYYWTGTTVMPEQVGVYNYAWYVAFGRAVDSAGKDLHGAGAVRFDQKVTGGPLRQDAERVFNFIRLVRSVQ